jgi:hypothetical protein
MDFEIYKITRPFIDNAVYYGQHCFQKSGGVRYMGTGKNILASLKKYGRAAHKKETLFIFQTQEEADAKEKQVIADALARGENLLNRDYGGQKTRIVSEATRKILSESHKGKCGWHHSPETRIKISSSRIGIGKGEKLSVEHRSKISKGLVGRKVSEKTREKIRESNRKNAVIEGAKPVICFDTGIKYISISEASRDTGICISSIARCANGEWRQTKGTHWAYA